MTIEINEQLKSLIPPLANEEYTQLEANILAEGIREPIILWDGIIVDGHNRYAIAQEYELEFKTVSKSFKDKDAVIEWMILNQFGRRNLSAYQRSLLALKLKPVFEEKAKENQGSRNDICQKSDRSIDTKKELSKLANVSHDTIAKVQKIEKEAPEEVKQQLAEGKKSINEAYKEIKSKEKEVKLQEAKEKILEQTKQTVEENKPKVYNMDCIKWLDTINECDLLITDPPYSTDVDNIVDFVDNWLFKALSKVKDTGRAYVFIGAYPDEIKAYLNARTPEHLKLEQILVWSYKNTLGNNPKDRYKLNYQDCLYFKGINAPGLDCPVTNEQWAVQEINAPDGRVGDRYHAWQKPMEIAERFIRHSTKEGDIVIDPFVCTGTFVIASNKLKRVGYGCDINKDNLKIAVERGCELVDKL